MTSLHHSDYRLTPKEFSTLAERLRFLRESGLEPSDFGESNHIDSSSTDPSVQLHRAIHGPGPKPCFPGIVDVDFDTYRRKRWLRRQRSRPTVLRDEAVRVYEAISFYNWSRGRTFNVMLTVSFQALTPKDPMKSQDLFSSMNKAIREWLRVGLAEGSRRRLTPRAMMDGCEHQYVWVAENARDRGLHVHQLMYVPPRTFRLGTGRRLRIATHLERYVRHWWSVRLQLEKLPDDAIHLTYFGRTDVKAGVEKQWEKFRYLMKTLHPTAFRLPGTFLPGGEVFRPDEFRATEPAPVCQLAGTSMGLGRKQRQMDEFVSAYARDEFDQLYTGWEIRDHEQREEYRRWEEEAAKSSALLKSLYI